MIRLRTLGIAALLGLLGLVGPRLASAQIVISPPPPGSVLILNPNLICFDNANQDVCLSRGGPGILTIAAVGLANNLDLDIDLETSATQIDFSSPAGATGITLTGLDLTMGSGLQFIFDGGSELDGNTANTIEQRNDLDPQTWLLFESLDGANFTGLSIDAGVTAAGEMRIAPITGGSGAASLDLVLASIGPTGDIRFETSDDILFQRGSQLGFTVVPAPSVTTNAGSLFQHATLTRTTTLQPMFRWTGIFGPASGTPTEHFFSLNPTINWATPAAGSYSVLYGNATETSIPTAINYLIEMGVDEAPVFTVTTRGSLGILEQAAATADAAGIGQLWVRDDTPNMLFFTDDEGTDFLIGGESVFKSYTFAARSGSSGEFFQAGFYDYSVDDANLSDGGATVTHGAANAPYGAHAFIVSGGNGTTDGSDLVLTVTGTSITDAGVRDAGGTEVIEATAEVSALNAYFETSLKWIGTITYTLTSAGGGTFNYDFNYGFAKYDDFGDEDYVVTNFESVGEPNTDDAGFNIQLLHHNATGWTYHVDAFVAGNTPIADMNVDYSTEQDIDGGVPFAYKRTNLATLVIGSGAEGVLIRVTTSANGAITYQDTHIGVDLR